MRGLRHQGWIPGTPQIPPEALQVPSFCQAEFVEPSLRSLIWGFFLEIFAGKGRPKGTLGLNWDTKHPMVSDMDFSVHLRATDGPTKAVALGGCAVLARKGPGARFDNQDFSVQPGWPPQRINTARREQGSGSPQRARGEPPPPVGTIRPSEKRSRPRQRLFASPSIFLVPRIIWYTVQIGASKLRPVA